MNNTEKSIETNNEKTVEPKQVQKSLTIRTGIRGGLAVRLMID